MMLHPTVQELTGAKNVNRYTAVIAAAKGARLIVDKQNSEREENEIARDASTRDQKNENVFEKEGIKAVSTAVQMIMNGEIEIKLPEDAPTK